MCQCLISSTLEWLNKAADMCSFFSFLFLVLSGRVFACCWCWCHLSLWQGVKRSVTTAHSEIFGYANVLTLKVKRPRRSSSPTSVPYQSFPVLPRLQCQSRVCLSVCLSFHTAFIISIYIQIDPFDQPAMLE